MSDQRHNFDRRVTELAQRVERWAERGHWATKVYPKRMRDEMGDIYELPALLLQKGPTRLLLDPVAYDVPGSEGLVDLYLLPTYDDMASLYLENNAWTIHYPVGTASEMLPAGAETQRLVLNDDNLKLVLESIATHAAPSV